MTVDLVCIDRPTAIHRYERELAKRLTGSVKVIALESLRLRSPLSLWRYARALKRGYRGGIIHFCDPRGPECHINIAGRFARSVLTVWHHDPRRLFFHLPPFITYKSLYRSFDRLIASSHQTANDLVQECGIDPSRIRVVYAGYDPAVFYPRLLSVNRMDSPPYVLYVGTSVRRKNPERMLSAFRCAHSLFPNLRLMIVGHAFASDQAMTHLIDSLGIRDSVDIAGTLSDHELAVRYTFAKLLLIPSLQEGFGLPIVEAMACGCPVVTSSRAPMTELVGHTQVLTDPESIESIADGITKVLEDGELAKRMSQDGIKRSRQFTWSATAEHTQQVYRDLWD
jgi:glycosyltransferase involved in cell wall biosynthesis